MLNKEVDRRLGTKDEEACLTVLRRLRQEVRKVGSDLGNLLRLYKK